MAFTYDSAALSEPRNSVRLRIGDTEDRKLFSLDDAEVDFAVSEHAGNVPQAAIFACELLIAKLTPATDRNAAGVTAQRAQRREALEKLLIRLEARAVRAAGPLLPGGISRDQKREIEQDTDFLNPAFTIGQDDSRRTDQTQRRRLVDESIP